MSQGGDTGFCVWKFANNVWTIVETHCKDGFQCVTEVNGTTVLNGRASDPDFTKIRQALTCTDRGDDTVEVPCVRGGKLLIPTEPDTTLGA